jgi:hypothetical protein
MDTVRHLEHCPVIDRLAILRTTACSFIPAVSASEFHSTAIRNANQT